ncbi:uncharacterized protein LOC118184799 [Stegodyphus dumicola]|uniref:uncharacterized protein LOC118184799 n=1 Tax=Stegodyphus dumicola TaxID=202533 RepID=UPI0015AD36BD|nr:uncharacterized protein LOC118184799 [Stegodyphus dumicola]
MKSQAVSVEPSESASDAEIEEADVQLKQSPTVLQLNSQTMCVPHSEGCAYKNLILNQNISARKELYSVHKSNANIEIGFQEIEINKHVPTAKITENCTHDANKLQSDEKTVSDLPVIEKPERTISSDSCGGKLSADKDATEEFTDEFSVLVAEENLSPEQDFNMDETGLFWRFLPRKTYVTSEESAPSGVKDAKERVTILVCSNAAGTYKCKPVLVGKSTNLRALKGVKSLPVIYRSNKNSWFTKQLMTE